MLQSSLHYQNILGKIMEKPKIITKLESNLRNYEQHENNRKEGSILKDYTLEDYTKLLDDFKSNVYRIKSSIS